MREARSSHVGPSYRFDADGTSQVPPGVGHSMSGLLFPQNDVGVAIQVGVLAAVVATGLIVARRDRDLRLLVGGIGLLLFSLIAVQAVH